MDHDSRLNLHFNYITFDGGINFIEATDHRNSDIFDQYQWPGPIRHDTASVMVRHNRSKRIWHRN